MAFLKQERLMAKIELALGVDIGGTNTKYGYVDRNGNCLASGWMPTGAHEPADLFFKRLHDNSNILFRDVQDSELIGIGIGAPNANYYKATIENPPNLDWKFVDVRAELEKYYSVPIAVTNDANAAALGEMLFGAAQGMKDFIVITLGTGLGSGIVANGQLIYGSDGFAGEIGHTTVDPQGRQCGCGKRGCLETYCSATGLRRTIQELICNTSDTSELRSISFAELTSEMVYEAALRKDPLALKAFHMCGHVLGLKLADSVAHLSPEAIILFGGLASAGELIFDPVKKSLEEHLFPIFRNKVKLLPSRLKGNTAVLGAAALIWNLKNSSEH
jgi:glucokinase